MILYHFAALIIAEENEVRSGPMAAGPEVMMTIASQQLTQTTMDHGRRPMAKSGEPCVNEVVVAYVPLE